jgi:hypothetical protein
MPNTNGGFVADSVEKRGGVEICRVDVSDVRSLGGPREVFLTVTVPDAAPGAQIAKASTASLDINKIFKTNHWAGASWFLIAAAAAALILSRAGLL